MLAALQGYCPIRVIPGVVPVALHSVSSNPLGVCEKWVGSGLEINVFVNLIYGTDFGSLCASFTVSEQATWLALVDQR